MCGFIDHQLQDPKRQKSTVMTDLIIRQMLVLA